MVQIIDNRGSGKTSRLMLLAKENNGILVCANPEAMKVKAHAYGLTGLEFVSYYDYAAGKYDRHKPVFVDELEYFVRSLCNNLSGYSITIGD